jgi:hypothetical protein
MMRYCTNSDCRGDCETCNRAPIENQPLPKQSFCDDSTLEAVSMRVRNGTSTVEDAQRLLCAYQCASSEVLMAQEERFGLRC